MSRLTKALLIALAVLVIATIALSYGPGWIDPHPLRHLPSISAAFRLLSLTGWEPPACNFLRSGAEQSMISRPYPYTARTACSRVVPRGSPCV